jgi:hypothetical protein
MLDLCYAGVMAAMDSIASKFAEYEYTIKLLTAKLEELAAENERLTSALGGAHATLRTIYSDSNQPAGVRVKAAQAALPHETPRLNPVSQLELAAEEEIEPLADVIRRQRARADRMMLEPPFSDLPKVSPFRPNGNGSDDDTAG